MILSKKATNNLQAANSSCLKKKEEKELSEDYLSRSRNIHVARIKPSR